MVGFLALKEDLEKRKFVFNPESGDVWGRASLTDVDVAWDVIYSGKIRVGIDPEKYFDKTSSCSVLAYFPLDEGEYDQLVHFFDECALDSGKQGQQWREEAKHSFCGSYAKFGSKE